MKNKVIVILITLMTIALVGIIFIQILWINNTAIQRKEVLQFQIYDALDAVNKEISKGENLEFFERKFGGLDSLLIDLSSKKDVKLSNNDTLRKEVIIYGDDTTSPEEQEIRIKYSSHDSVVSKSINSIDTVIEVKINDELKSISSWQGKVQKKTEELSKMAEHFVFEKMLIGGITHRIQKDSLFSYIKKALVKQGIAFSFSFGVYDLEEGRYEEDFCSNDFNRKDDFYQLNLFPQDQLDRDKYQLRLQLNNEDAFIWSGIQNMIWLSLILTILLIICFSYALYFIYKQKKISNIKSDFINNMSHELKTPLASISLASASIQHPEMINKKEEVKRLAKIIDEERTKMNQHIERILEMSLAEQGRFVVEKEQVDLRYLLNESVKNVQSSIENSGGQIVIELKESIFFQGDQLHLIHAFTNIFENSIKYCNKQPKIEVSILESQNEILIVFKDNGIGMTSKTTKLAFDQFYRATSGNLHDRKGFGLGLSYVKTVIEAHNGEINLESSIGEGTSITIKLPAK